MKIVFKKIPKLAIYFYLVGLILLSIAMTNYLKQSPFMGEVLMQQVFIAGAIIMALGSVINSLFQFKK